MLRHYFITTLKPIILGEPTPISIDDFLRRAEECLSAPMLIDLRMLAEQKLVELARMSHLPFLRSFAEETLRLYAAVGYVLGKADGLSDESIYQELSIRGTGDKIEIARHPAMSGLEAGLKNPDPFVLEKYIAMTVVKIADEYACSETFSHDQIFVYFIKLLMCERWSLGDENRGYAVLDDLAASVIRGMNQ